MIGRRKRNYIVMRNARDNMKLFDDLARMATGAIGSFSEVRTQIKSLVRENMAQVMSSMDMVSREEFERVEAVAIRAREKQEELDKRLAALEKNLKPKKTSKKGKKK